MLTAVPVLAALAAALPPSAPPPGAAALAPSAVAGKLVVVDGSSPVPIGDVRRRLGGKPLAVQLRSGGRVVLSPVADDGVFAAELDPGEWIVEGVECGAKFEFVDPPREVAPRVGELSCAGQLTLTFRDLPAEFGQATGRWDASDGCAAIAGRLKGLARGRTVRTRLAEELPTPPVERSAWELLAMPRVSYGWWSAGAESDSGEVLTGTLILGINRPVTSRRAISLAVSASQMTGEGWYGDALATRRWVSAGLTYDPLGGLELMAGPEVSLDGDGARLYAQARLGGEGFAFYGRVAAGGGGRTWLFGLEIAPAWFVGGFL